MNAVERRAPATIDAFAEVIPALLSKTINKQSPTTIPDMIRGGDGPLRCLHKYVELRCSPIEGYGLFATKLIRKGEVVWRDSRETSLDEVHKISDIQTWPEEKRDIFLHFAYQVSSNEMSGCIRLEDAGKDAARFQNHSCDPSTWFSKNYTMTARRDIQPDEEITYDYGTSETYYDAFPECRCGSKLCRKAVTKDDWKLKDLRERFKGHFEEYIQEMIDSEALADSA